MGCSSPTPGSLFTRGCLACPSLFFFVRLPPPAAAGPLPAALRPACCSSSLTRLGIPKAIRRARFRAMLQSAGSGAAARVGAPGGSQPAACRRQLAVRLARDVSRQ